MGKCMRKLLSMGCGCALTPLLALAGPHAARAEGDTSPAGQSSGQQTGHATKGQSTGTQGDKTDEAAPPVVAAEMVTAPFTVVEVDKHHRKVTLQSADGDRTTVSVPPEIQGFDQLKKGDKIEIDYYRSLAASILPPGAATTTRERQEVKNTSVGGLVTHEITATAQILAINPKDNTVKVKGPEGKTETVTVKDPDALKQLSALKPGDMVQLTYTEAVAAAIRPQQHG
jgi:translation elongation factor P/translation initiation factor 5A